MEIGFDTVGYALLCIIGAPVLNWKPRLLVYLLVIITMFPIHHLKDGISFGHVNVFLEDLILLVYCCLAVAFVFKRLIAQNNIFSIPGDAKPIVVFILLYIFMHFAFIVIGVYQGISVDSIVRRFLVYSGCLYFFFPLLFFHDIKQIKTLLIFITIIAVFYPLWQAYTFLASPLLNRFITSSQPVRLGGGGLPLLACALFGILIWKNEVKYYILLAGPIISILLTGHRSAFLALMLSLMLLFKLTKDIAKSLLFVYLGGFALILSLIAFETITGHNFSGDVIVRGRETINTENVTTLGRIEKIKDNWSVFEKKPIMGIGYHHEQLGGLFQASSEEDRKENGLINRKNELEKNFFRPHNFIMRFLSHTGIIGTFIIISIIWLVLKRCQLYIFSGGLLKNYGIFLFCSIAFFLTLALMNTTFVAEGWVFWILCGVTIRINEEFFKTIEF